MRNERSRGRTAAAAVGIGAIALAAGLASGLHAAPAGPPAEVAWAYPVAETAPPPSKEKDRTIPGAAIKLSEAEITDVNNVADWFPKSHPPMPKVVKNGPTVPAGAYHGACAYCHLPNGLGRPENYALAGLPLDYLRRQMDEIGGDERKVIDPSFTPTGNMHLTVAASTPSEREEAAKYFSSLKYTPHFQVVEAAMIPKAEQSERVYRFATDGSKEPIGARIVEGPPSFQRFHDRDPVMSYIAYVPPGAIARGAALAANKAQPALACASCHGAGLKGGSAAIGPPLAGRSPSAIFRQIYAFNRGYRSGQLAPIMKPVVASLSIDQMIDLAAYAGSLKP